jgi:hypothetical protein
MESMSIALSLYGLRRPGCWLLERLGVAVVPALGVCACTPCAHGARKGRVRVFFGGALRCLAGSGSPSPKEGALLNASPRRGGRGGGVRSVPVKPWLSELDVSGWQELLAGDRLGWRKMLKSTKIRTQLML